MKRRFAGSAARIDAGENGVVGVRSSGSRSGAKHRFDDSLGEDAHLGGRHERHHHEAFDSPRERPVQRDGSRDASRGAAHLGPDTIDHLREA